MRLLRRRWGGAMLASASLLVVVSVLAGSLSSAASPARQAAAGRAAEVAPAASGGAWSGYGGSLGAWAKLRHRDIACLAGSCFGPWSTMWPLPSIQAEMPVFAAITIGRRFSTAR